MGELCGLHPTVGGSLGAATCVQDSAGPECRNLQNEQPTSGIAVGCRPPRDAAKGVAAAVTAASTKSRKRSNPIYATNSSPDEEVGRRKESRRGVSVRGVPSAVTVGSPTVVDVSSTPSAESLDTHADRSEETEEDDEQAAAIVAMLASAHHYPTTPDSVARHKVPAVSRKPGSPTSAGASSPNRSDGSSDAFDTLEHEVRPNSAGRRVLNAMRRSTGKCRTFRKAVPSSGSPFAVGAVSKRQPGNAGETASAVGRTRPTNNQLLYKAYFRWEHYPYKVAGASRLSTETEACASVTSAFLQVLASLHEAESQREDAPRNILRLLSTNTRRTKVVELTSGTHRVPDELRRHCLTDAAGGQYSTNLDRNRYGSDNQYLNTVVRYDLDFLGLCPALVDVEIIDAKNGDNTRLIQAQPHQCCCGCATLEQATPSLEKKRASGSGIFDMLVAAAAADARSGSDDESAEREDEDYAATSEHVEEEGRPVVKLENKAEVASARGVRRNESVTSMAALDNSDAPAIESRAEVARLRARLADAEARAEGAEAIRASEARLKALKSETEALMQLRRSGESSTAPELQKRCTELESRVASLVQERDAFAAAYSYYSVWVQQLQAEVTNLLRAAHSNGGSVSHQLLSLTHAVNPSNTPPTAAVPSTAEATTTSSSTPPAESETDALLRAQYERQLQELLQQHFQVARQQQQQAAAVKSMTPPGPIAAPSAHHAIFMPPSSTTTTSQPTAGLKGAAESTAMEIIPLQFTGHRSTTGKSTAPPTSSPPTQTLGLPSFLPPSSAAN